MFGTLVTPAVQSSNYTNTNKRKKPLKGQNEIHDRSSSAHISLSKIIRSMRQVYVTLNYLALKICP